MRDRESDGIGREGGREIRRRKERDGRETKRCEMAERCEEKEAEGKMGG